MSQKGKIGVTTENIFPVIKKFLYSDHEIFLREMVSNAVDASQKLKTLAVQGDFKGEMGELKVCVSLDEKAKTLTISDRGIGMTEEEIDKYINQIAFSGVTDFLEKYKDNANAIIGHFGLGFYSSFMVSDRVDIITKSYKEGAKAVKWSCDGSLNLNSKKWKRLTEVQISFSISLTIARSSWINIRSRNCSTNIVSSWLFLWYSARRQNGKMVNRWTPRRITLLIMWNRFGQRLLLR